MGDYFTEFRAQQTLIAKVIKEEEEGFLSVPWTRGCAVWLEEKNTDGDRLDGENVFELYDTYGFPVDLTALI